MTAALWAWLSTPQALAAGIWLLGIVLAIQTLYVAIRDAVKAVQARRAQSRSSRRVRDQTAAA